jgi:glycosyltransferase involved in cell wall biosynthesis
MQTNYSPMVSVLMTAYNREKYISEAIESVLASSYKNFELIVVDDVSKDRTVEIARQYAAKDERVKVFVNRNNLGDYPNRNKAASYAIGKYIKYVDADDYIYPWGLEMLISMMEANPLAGWGLCSLAQIKSEPYPVLKSPYEAYRHAYFGPGLFHKAPLSSIIKRDIFNFVSGFSNMRMVGDFEMWHRLALDYPVLLMPDGIVWYREHGDQEAKDIDLFKLKYEQISTYYLFHERCPLSKKEVLTFVKQRRLKHLRNSIVYLIKGRFSKFLMELKILRNYYRKRIQIF